MVGGLQSTVGELSTLECGRKSRKEEGHHPGRKEAVFLWMEDAVQRRGKTWPAPQCLFLCAACVHTPKIVFVSAIRLAAVLY